MVLTFMDGLADFRAQALQSEDRYTPPLAIVAERGVTSRGRSSLRVGDTVQ